ncbi:NUDIX domain-containing protein [Lacticaseibacillus jixianensis]|uniref:NUDIX domain-containing protein n=1 Tax=Lacticaseibacillus jixianensis TaxID=2486012 RepID=A0ABW4B7U3_9LACO|nr:NUDIX domain-containing protein [Lacticaseibacillus jixianensis]
MTKQLTVGLVSTKTGVVMINRAKPPYRGLWNGLGGKVEPGETPFEGMAREFHEESGLMLPPDRFHACGLVHWYVDEALRGDLFLFTAHTSQELTLPMQTREGIVAAMAPDWLKAPDNLGLVPDLAAMLPYFEQGTNVTLRSDFAGDRFLSLTVANDD